MYIWSGVYSDFSKIKVQSRGYCEEKLIYETIGCMNNRDLLFPETLNHNFLVFLVSLKILEGKPITILDFGGGAGIAYAAIKNSLNIDSLIDYHIIETSPMVKIASELWKNDLFIHFYSEMPKLDKNPDIVYSNSSLQYVENYKDIIGKLCNYNSNFILLSRFSAVNSKTYASIQQSSGVMIPYWFINLKELIEIVEQYNYKLLFKTNSVRVYNQDNFEESFRMNRTTDLLFVKK